MKNRSRILWWAAFLLLAALCIHFLAAVLRPAHVTYGSTWAEYRAEPQNSIDVLFLGSSYAYCDWNPSVLYRESGLTGYVMGGSEQTPSITYWYLREALRTQTPSLVVMEGSSLFFDRYQNYTQINVGYMPWGVNRVLATLTAAEPDKRLGLFFDLYFYHDRWKEVTLSDVKKAVTPAKADYLKGHTAVDQVFDNTGGGPFLSEMRQSEEQYRENLSHFAKIAALCREKGIDLLVTVNPTYSQYVPAVYERLEKDIAQASQGYAAFANWADGFADAGLDPTLHLYDGGHLNQAGAKVFSAWTGRQLLDRGYLPREQTAANRQAWEAAAAQWE